MPLDLELARSLLERAWQGWEPLHMGVVSIGVSGWIVHHEFASVWERRGQTIRRLVSGVGVAGIDRQGRFVWLRESFDPSGTLCESVHARPEITALEPEGGFDTGAQMHATEVGTQGRLRHGGVDALGRSADAAACCSERQRPTQ